MIVPIKGMYTTFPCLVRDATVVTYNGSKMIVVYLQSAVIIIMDAHMELIKSLTADVKHTFIEQPAPPLLIHQSYHECGDKLITF